MKKNQKHFHPQASPFPTCSYSISLDLYTQLKYPPSNVEFFFPFLPTFLGGGVRGRSSGTTSIYGLSTSVVIVSAGAWRTNCPFTLGRCSASLFLLWYLTCKHSQPTLLQKSKIHSWGPSRGAYGSSTRPKMFFGSKARIGFVNFHP